MKDRIITLIKAMNYTSAQFADEIGVQKSGISHIISGRNNPSLDFVQKILQRFPEINMEWLIMGKGQMIRGGESIKENIAESTLFPFPENKNPGLDLFSEEISPAFEVKPDENIAETIDSLSTKSIIEQEPAKTKYVEQEEVLKKNVPTLEAGTQTLSNKKLERVLFFYSDKSFSEYKPEA